MPLLPVCLVFGLLSHHKHNACSTMANSFVGVWQEALRHVRAKDPDVDRVAALMDRLQQLPAPPKSAWKKVVRDMKVPLQLGVAFCSAAQRSPIASACPALVVTAGPLHILLYKAATAGLLGDGAGPLATSMRQQLQQAGVLPQLAQLMAALAADLRTEAAALGSRSSEVLLKQLRPTASAYNRDPLQQVVRFVAALYPLLQALWGCPTQAAADNSVAWLTDASRHAEAAMQLCMAALQHVSSVLQHVLPAVQQRAPQVAAQVQRDQAALAASAMTLTSGLTASLSEIQQHWTRQGLASSPTGNEARAREQLQQLLLSPHCVPCIASLLVLSSWYARQDCRRLQATSNSRGRTGGSNSSTSSGTSGHTPTPCQLKLLELLGLAPQLAAAVELTPAARPSEETHPLANVLTASRCCFQAAGEVGCTPVQMVQAQEQQQLWCLLPAVLVPFASSHLLCAAAIKDPQQQHDQLLEASAIVELSQTALLVSDSHSITAGGRREAWRPPHPGWLQEVLGGVLQLADQVLLQSQQQHAAVAAAGVDMSSSTSSRHAAQAECTAEVVDLLGALANLNMFWIVGSFIDSTTSQELGSSNSSSDSGQAVPHAAASAEAAAGASASSSPTSQLAVAERLVDVCATLEAGIRTVTAAAQVSPLRKISPALIVDKCLRWLFLVGNGDAASSIPALVLHLGLARPEAVPAELRQLYSLLSTVQKLGRCQPVVAPGQLCSGQEAADTCCCAAAHAAAILLQPVKLLAGSTTAQLATGGAASSLQAAVGAAAVLQQPESSFLPSLVILGRCCLVWAGQLQQQAPQLLQVVAFSTAGGQQGQQPQQQQRGVQFKHSAACHRVCIPGVQQQEEAAAGAASTGTLPPCELEQITATVSDWVGGVTTPAAQAALAAAAGGDSPQQLLQQLDALAAAQQAVRQGLTDVSLSALVQQLQATGVMLSSVAVPDFRNNAGCGNISGPTEVGLVSRRSCLCSGCRTARFCGRACQRAAWPQHKRVCKALAASSAAAAACSSS